jgi:hypothetical protein
MRRVRWIRFAPAAVLAVVLAGCHGAEPLTGPVLASSGLPQLCLATTLWVRADAGPGGTGTGQSPFSDLRTALAAAAKISCDVRINVADGVYVESDKQAGPLTITRSLSIIGHGTPTIVGSFVVSAAGPVRIEGLEITGSAGAAIRVTNSNTALRLSRVRIDGVDGFGVAQEGGTLTASLVDISNVTSHDKNPAWGTALAIGGGTRADLLLVHLHDNVHGLYATGTGTTVNATGLLVERTGFYPGLPDLIAAGGCDGIGFNHLGAVEFAAGAQGTGFGWTIDHSAMAGLYAHDDATVRASIVRVSFSSGVPGTPPSTEACGGFNVIAHRNGQIELTRVQIEDAGVCGVIVGGAPGTGIDLHIGHVIRSPIGACLQQDGYDRARLRDRVVYRDVGVPLQATTYELPDVLP